MSIKLQDYVIFLKESSHKTVKVKIVLEIRSYTN